VLGAVSLVLGALWTPVTEIHPPVARASVLAADAADYVPTAASLPGFREESSDADGGDLDPTISQRRSFISPDGNRRVIVTVSVGSSIANAESMLSARINQLVQYQKWTIGRSDAISDSGYEGSGPGPDGRSAAMMAFRIFAVMSEVTVTSADGDPDVPLLDNVSRLVAARIMREPDAIAQQAGIPSTPVVLPGTDPIAVDVNGAPLGTGTTGAEVTGSSSGSSVQGDTIVVVTVSSVDRPWAYAGSAPRPPQDMEYDTVNLQISATGPTQVVVALTDFWISTFDGRSWSPVTGRGPSLQPGNIQSGTPVTGWLTFMIPTSQPALQLTWRIRTTQSLDSQGNTDQTLVIPLTAGATSQASVGSSAPPADKPVVPPSSAPSGPTGPAGPSGPSAPVPTPGSDSGTGSGTGNGGGNGGGGSRTPRGGGRLQ
jgi:hypothetical protein